MLRKITKQLILFPLVMALALLYGFTPKAGADDWLQPADWGDTAHVFKRNVVTPGSPPYCRFELDDFEVPAETYEVIGISFWMNKAFGCHFPTYFMYDDNGQPGNWFADRTTWDFTITDEGTDPNGNPVVRYEYDFSDDPIAVTPGATYWIALSSPPCPGHYDWGLHNTPLDNGWGSNAKWCPEGTDVTPTPPYTNLDYPAGHTWYGQQVDVAFEIRFAGPVVPLDADFSGEPRTGVAPHNVNFTSEVTGGVEPYSYEWDLDGDGEFDDAFVANPTYIYDLGRYDVSLRVTDDATTEITVTKERYIQVNEAGTQSGCISNANPDTVWFLFGDTVTESCTFDGNMVRPTGVTGHGLFIGAENITIDGNGYCLDGDVKSCIAGTGDGDSGIYNYFDWHDESGYDNVTIKNLEIKNFCNGIKLLALSGNTVECCEIHDNGDASVAESRNAGIWQYSVSSTTVNSCKIYSNESDPAASGPPGGHGIYLCHGDDNLWTGNEICDNQKAGIIFRCAPNRTQVTHNYVHDNNFGGIRAQCINDRDGLFAHNYSCNNNEGAGIFVGGPDNTLEYNTCINNNGSSPGWEAGNGIRLDRSAKRNHLHMNTCCGNVQEDIWVCAPPGCIDNTGVDNACSTTMRFDDAGYTGCRYACFDIDGTVTGGAGLDSVAIENLDGTNPEMKKWDQVKIVGDHYYHSMGGADSNGVVRDVAEGDIIRLIAKDGENAIGVEDHTVTPAEMTASAFTQDILMDEWYLDLHKFPWYEAKDGDTQKYSGPAVARMWLSYLWWDNAYGPGCPPDYEHDQDWLLTYGMNYNYDTTTEDLLDPRGLRYTVQHNDPSGYNFSVRRMNDEDYALHTICRWIAYDVYNNPAGHPDHVPAATPTNGNYDNWMAPRGVHTSDNPWTAGSYDVFGFWINDPAPDGIGANSYKTATEWSGDLAVPDDGYYQKIVSGDECNDKYVAIVEPPDHDAEVRIVRPAARFERAIRPVMTENLLEGLDEMVLIKELEDEDALNVVKAAIDGVTDELIPYDPLFAATFAKTVAGGPLLVNNESGDYYLVSFNLPTVEPTESVEIQKLNEEYLEVVQVIEGKVVAENIPIEKIKVNKKNTLVVVLVDAEDGSFKETSWVDDPMKYLPVSKEEALKLVLADVGTSETKQPIIELVNIDNSPYYPAWKITIDKKVFYVSQDGTVSM